MMTPRVLLMPIYTEPPGSASSSLILNTPFLRVEKRRVDSTSTSDWTSSKQSAGLVTFQLLGSFVETNSFKCFRFNLADTLSSDTEFTADFFERVADTVVGEAVAHLEDF